MLHDEADRIAAAAASEALIDLFSGRNGEGRGLFIMKRAKSEIIRASFLEFHETAHDVDNIEPSLYLLYGSGGDQIKNTR